jgi:nitrate/nitrite transporter NarK
MPIFGFAVCLTLSVMLKSQIWLSYMALIGCGVFVHTASSNFWTIPPLIFGSDNSGGVRGIINAIGSLGGFLGPYLVGYLKVAYGNDVSVYSLVLILMVGFALVLTLPATKSLSIKENISL